MIVDSSVIVALLQNEPDAELFKDILLANVGALKMSAASYLETGIVIDGNKNIILSTRLDEVLTELEIEIVAVSFAQARAARAAHVAFGRWSKSEAKLNFGDCFVYALSKDASEPLLFKGDDFSKTDIVSAI